MSPFFISIIVDYKCPYKNEEKIHWAFKLGNLNTKCMIFGDKESPF